MNEQQKLTGALKYLAKLNTDLVDLCAKHNPAFLGFKIEKISKEDEMEILRHGVNYLDVQALEHWTELHTVLNAWGSFYKADGFSTRFVDRVPGIVVLNNEQDTARELILLINEAKLAVKEIVQKNIGTQQRHQFIHLDRTSLMTEHVYRQVHCFDYPVANVWFNWASRPVPKTFTIKEAEKYLMGAIKKPRFMSDPQFWEQRVLQCIDKVKSGQYSKIQKLREYRVLPTIELQYLDELGQKKRKRSNATTPILLLGQDANILPKISRLKPYVKKIDDKPLRLSPNKEMIFEPLALVGCKEIVL